jgi:enoyl-CoA hydratase
MTKILFLFLLFLLACKIQSLKELEYKEERAIGILKINYPMKSGLNTKALEDINNILNKINTTKIRALIIDTIFDKSKLNSVDKETQKLIDSYIKYGKETKQKIEISPFPGFLPVTGFLVLVNGEVVKQVITGNNNLYSNPDIEEMAKMTKKEAIKFSEKGNYVLKKIETFPIPVIFVADSFCMGTCLQISLSCDIRISSNDTLFALPEVSYGIMPGFGGTQRLARILGPGMAKQLIYTGGYLESKEALKYGLVNAIYSKDTLLNEAKKIAENIGKKSLNAIKNSKKAINEGLQENIDKALIIEENLFGDCFETQEQKANMENFLKKGK